MRKPGAIILTLVGTAVAGGVGMSACSRRTGPDGTSHRTNAPPPADQVILEKEYTNDSYIAGVGYYNAPYFGWFPYKYNFFDSTRGYFHGGNWTPQANAAVMASSKPTPAAIALAREAYLKANPASNYRGSSYYSRGYRSSGLNSYAGGGHGSTSFTSSDGTGSHTTGASHVSSVSHGGFGGSAHSSGS
jgi:hypothetical protein